MLSERAGYDERQGGRGEELGIKYGYQCLYKLNDFYDFDNDKSCHRYVITMTYTTLMNEDILRTLATSGATLALVISTILDEEDLTTLRNQLSPLKETAHITMHRGDISVGSGFQAIVSAVLSTHRRVDHAITDDGEVVNTVSYGTDEDQTQMLIYTAFTHIEACRLRRCLTEDTAQWRG